MAHKKTHIPLDSAIKIRELEAKVSKLTNERDNILCDLNKAVGEISGLKALLAVSKHCEKTLGDALTRVLFACNQVNDPERPKDACDTIQEIGDTLFAALEDIR